MIRSLLLTLLTLSSAALAQETRTYGLGAQLGIAGGVPVTGLEFTTAMQDRLQLSYAYVQGRTDVSDVVNATVVPYISKADFGVAEASANLRYFVSRTFYVGGGIGYRILDLDIAGRDYIDNIDFEGSYKGQALQAKALIGNSWSFANGFYLGVDWVGVSAPIAVTESKLRGTETDRDTNIALYRTEGTDKDYKNSADRIGRASMASLLTLRLGFSF